MKFLSILIISIFTISANQAKGNDLDSLYETRWLVNAESGNVKDFENFEFITNDSPQAENLPYHLKYAGLTFKRDGTLIEHVWNKCGTGNPPDHFKANFKIEKIADELVIKITGSRIWDGEYKLIDLTETNLKMKKDEIISVGIDEQFRLNLKPKSVSFSIIYRTATEVHWNTENNTLFSPVDLQTTLKI